MDEIRSLQECQTRLLHEWLDAANGEARFSILTELRIVERELGERARKARLPHKIRTFSVRSVQ
ncbi:MAG: hypothetical protein ACYCYO_15565 [Bacilli bacterium]